MRLALVAVAMAVAAAACAGTESEPDLAQAAERTGLVSSFAYEVHVTGVNLGEREEYVCAGEVDDARSRARMVCDDGPMDEYEARRTGDMSYFRYARTAKWYETAGDVIAQFEYTSAERVLVLLRSASGQARRVGEEVVRSEPTVRYELTVDCEQAEVLCAEVVDVWIDGDGLVRRVETISESENVLRVEYFDFGLRVDVEAPPPDQIQQPRYPLPVRCGSQRAGPITAGDAIDVFRRHGFDVESFERWCSKGISAHLGNGGTTPVILNGSGMVLCTLYAEGASADVHEPLPEVVHLQALRTVENLECVLAAKGERAPERVSAFEATLDELRR